MSAFPEPESASTFGNGDSEIELTYNQIHQDWFPQLEEKIEQYISGKVLHEEVIAHLEAVPSYRLSDGAAPLTDRQQRLRQVADDEPVVHNVSEWYASVRNTVEQDLDDLTADERLLNRLGYLFGFVLFAGASSPSAIVRRLRFAYQVVGVEIDSINTTGGCETTTFTCPYRNVGSTIYGKRTVCHEKLDRVDDGYVRYLQKRGIDYQRPRGCDSATQCYSAVSRSSPEQWWPKTDPDDLSRETTVPPE